MVGIWGQTRNLDDRTLDPVDLTKRRSGGPSRRGAQIWGQTRCAIYQSGTFKVKRSTLNFQRGDRKGQWWRGYGDRHGAWKPAEQIEGQTRYLSRASGLLAVRTCPRAGRRVEAGSGTQIWGQTRCRVCRPGTLKVQRPTLNFQRGDRKGA